MESARAERAEHRARSECSSGAGWAGGGVRVWTGWGRLTAESRDRGVGGGEGGGVPGRRGGAPASAGGLRGAFRGRVCARVPPPPPGQPCGRPAGGAGAAESSGGCSATATRTARARKCPPSLPSPCAGARPPPFSNGVENGHGAAVSWRWAAPRSLLRRLSSPELAGPLAGRIRG